jgi:hypothetical protein
MAINRATKGVNMKPKFLSKHSPHLATLAITLATAANCSAQYNAFSYDPKEPESRAKRIDFYVLGEFWRSENVVMHNVTLPTGIGPGAPIATSDLHARFDDAGMWGFGLGYNLNSHFEIESEFTFGYPGYTFTWNGSSLSGEAFEQAGKFNLTYNILSSKLTPFVSAGIGYLYVDSGIPSGPPDYYAWWDYYWGYTVVGTVPTYDQTYFTVNGSVGVRWDVNDQIFLRALVNGNWWDAGHGGGWPANYTAAFEIGWKW